MKTKNLEKPSTSRDVNILKFLLLVTALMLYASSSYGQTYYKYSPSSTTSSVENFSDNIVSNLTDNLPLTYWQTATAETFWSSNTADVDFIFNEAREVTRISMTSWSNTDRNQDPLKLIILASNDQISWDTLYDISTNTIDLFSEPNQVITFDFTNTTNYLYYRISFVSPKVVSSVATRLALAEIAMFGNEQVANDTGSSLWGLDSTNNSISYQAGNVGIGNATPTVPLEVNGDVKATAFIGDGSQLTGVTATVDPSNTLLVSNRRPEGPHGTLTGPESIVVPGFNSQYLLSVQDGNGRVQQKWNATYGTNETFVVGNEDASFIDWKASTAGPAAPWLQFKFAEGDGKLAGDAIDWQTHFSLNASGNAAILGSVTAQSFIGDGSQLTGVTAIVDPSNTLLVSNRRPEGPHGTLTGFESIVVPGFNSQYLLSVQDGNGRVQQKWNATYGTNETFVVGNENASFLDWTSNNSTPNDKWMEFKYASGNGKAAGDLIDWQTHFSLSGNGDATVLGSVTAQSFIGDGSQLTGVTATVEPNNTSLISNMRPEGTHGSLDESIAIVVPGPSSQYHLSVQDGNGRVQQKWNATRGLNETFVVGNEDASFIDWKATTAGPAAPWLQYKFAEGNGKLAGDAIDWQTHFSLDASGNAAILGAVTAQAFIGDGSQLTNLPVYEQVWTRSADKLQYNDTRIDVDKVAVFRSGININGYDGNIDETSWVINTINDGDELRIQNSLNAGFFRFSNDGKFNANNDIFSGRDITASQDIVSNRNIIAYEDIFAENNLYVRGNLYLDGNTIAVDYNEQSGDLVVDGNHTVNGDMEVLGVMRSSSPLRVDGSNKSQLRLNATTQGHSTRAGLITARNVNGNPSVSLGYNDGDTDFADILMVDQLGVHNFGSFDVFENSVHITTRMVEGGEVQDYGFLGTTSNHSMRIGANSFGRILISKDGPVQISSHDDSAFPGYSSTVSDNFGLLVTKGILSEDLALAAKGDWADYVFNNDYQLTSLEDLEAFVKEHKHLPGIKGETKIKEDGFYQVHEALVGQLKNLEEQVLHNIAQEKKIKAQQMQLENQAQKIKEQQERMDKLEAMLQQLTKN